jgi:modulator of FtsH protease
MVAAAGASGALAGLVFVAVSINLSRIIELPGVASRASDAILILASALIGTLMALVPGQPPSRLGLELLVLYVPAGLLPGLVQIRDLVRRKYYRLHHAIWRLLLHQVATIPLVLAGLSLRGYMGGGMDWFASAVILAFAVGLINAWILLVEIMR